jgi:type IV pilus assembly protein PilC
MEIDFHYKAIDSKGDLVSGTKTSQDESTLKTELKSENLNLIHAEPISKFSFNSFFKNLKNVGTVNTEQRIVLYRNLGSMLEAGLSLVRALSVLERQTKNQKLKKVLREIIEKVKKGSQLSTSMLDYKSVFSPLVISMVQSGEESGNLVQALNVVSDQLDKQHTLNKKIKGAMIYPGVIISAMIFIGIFMLIYVVPTLTKTFKDLNVDLPASTMFIINFSDFVKNNILLAGIIFVVFVVGIYSASRTRIGKKGIAWFFLHLPVISGIVKEINSARTTRTLASLLNSGVSFVRALQITQDVVQNIYYKEIISEAEKNIQLGLPMSKVFNNAEKFYPPFVGEMMAVGEETGNIGPMLLKVAIFYENEVDQKTKNMSTIIEPILMIVVGIAIGFFAVSMISPMYSLVDSI